MRIRSFLMVFTAVGLLGGTSAAAQETQAGLAADAGLQTARALLNFGREDIVKDELRLSEETAAEFWPLYDAYQSELQVVRDRYAVILTDYSEAYRAGTVSEEQAKQLVEDYLDIKSELLAIKRDHVASFRRVLLPRMAARFYQIENKIEIELEYRLSLIVPLIDPV